MRERTPLEILKLQGSPNLRRSQRRDAAEENASLCTELRSEIAQLDELIAKALSACRRGQTFRGKPNPAFEHLTKLVKARDLLLRGHKPGKKSAQEILAEADAMLATPTPPKEVN
jgi:hypothetical protein